MFAGISFHIDGFSASQKNKLKRTIAENDGTTSLVLKKTTSFMVSDGKTRYKLQQATRYGIPIVKQLFVEACVVAEQLLYDLHAKEYVPTFEYNECELVWAPSETALDSVDAVSWEYDTQSSSSDPQTTDEGDTEFLFHLAGVVEEDWELDTSKPTSSIHSSQEMTHAPTRTHVDVKVEPIDESIRYHLSLAGKDVEIWVHGDNSKGQLVTGDKSYQFYPKYIFDTRRCTWGSGKKGQLGHSTKTWPARVGLPHHVTNMACGSAMTVCVDCENRVWSWGAKKYIGRPYGSEPDESLSKKASKKNTPKKNPSTSSVKHRRVGTSPVHITKSRSNPPNLKNPNTNLPSYKIPGIVDLPTAVVVTQICCGESHTVIRGETGKVYGWGANDMGQLGFHKRKPVLTPQEIDIAENVKSVQCGKDFTLLFDGEALYSCGNNSSGQLGRPTKDVTDATICSIARFDSCIMQVSCGEAHAACLLEDGTVWVWGCAANQRFGSSSSMDVFAPVRMTVFDKHKNGQTLTVGEGSIVHNEHLYSALSIRSDKFSKNRVLLVDVDSIFCGKGKYSFFAVNASSPSVFFGDTSRTPLECAILAREKESISKKT